MENDPEFVKVNMKKSMKIFQELDLKAIYNKIKVEEVTSFVAELVDGYYHTDCPTPWCLLVEKKHNEIYQ